MNVSEEGPLISKVLHRIWLGGPMPDLYDHGQTFVDHHPDWEHRLWTDEDLASDGWATRDLLDRATEFAPDDHIRFKVDVARLEILARHGGVYVDCDVVCLRPMDPLLEYSAFVAQSPNALALATNAVMGCEPGHPFVEAMLDGLPERAERCKGRRVVESVGGHYLSESMYGHDVRMLPWWWFASQSIRDRRMRRPADPRHGPEGFVDHLYANTSGDDPGAVGAFLRRMKASIVG